MSGGTYYHSLTLARLITTLNVAFAETDCDASSSDTKVRAAGNLFYSDTSVVCGAPVYHGRSKVVITNKLSRVWESSRAAQTAAGVMTLFPGMEASLSIPAPVHFAEAGRYLPAGSV